MRLGLAPSPDVRARAPAFDGLRHGAALVAPPTLLALAGHYHYEPRPVAVARGNEKGRVERAIRYIRTVSSRRASFATWPT
jgi:hypothetical protein